MTQVILRLWGWLWGNRSFRPAGRMLIASYIIGGFFLAAFVWIFSGAWQQ